MARMEAVDTAIGVAGFLLAVVLLVVSVVRLVLQRRREAAGRRRVLEALAGRFGLSESGPREVAGRIGRREVVVWFQKGYLLTVRIELAARVLPRAVRVVEFPDGPYQKQEALHIGGAATTGDEEFDSRFLVFAPPDVARGIPGELRRCLLDHPVPDMVLSRGELSCLLPMQPAAAVSRLEELLALGDAIEALGAPT